ncbi:unnamed protein product [Phaeothamnion confervicola]
MATVTEREQHAAEGPPHPATSTDKSLPRPDDSLLPLLVPSTFEKVDETFKPYVRLASREPATRPYELMRTAVCAVVLLPVRAVLMIVLGLLMTLVAKIAMIGIPTDSVEGVFMPLSTPRAVALMVLRPMARVVLWCLGIWVICRKKVNWEDLAEVAPKEQQPPVKSRYTKPFVVAANHLGYIDIAVLFVAYGGAFVAKDAIANVPLVGTIARAIQTLFVRPKAHVADEIRERVLRSYEIHDHLFGTGSGSSESGSGCSGDGGGGEGGGESSGSGSGGGVDGGESGSGVRAGGGGNKSGGEGGGGGGGGRPAGGGAHGSTVHGREGCCGACLSTLVIFPEGTTTNGTAMVRFRTGVFRAGMPVLPVAVVLPWRHFNPSWETISFKDHLFRTMTQLVNRVRLVELPLYCPSPAERADPRLYADNVQASPSLHVLHQPVYPLNRRHKFVYHDFVLGKKTAEEALQTARELTLQDPAIAAEAVEASAGAAATVTEPGTATTTVAAATTTVTATAAEPGTATTTVAATTTTVTATAAALAGEAAPVAAAAAEAKEEENQATHEPAVR